MLTYLSDQSIKQERFGRLVRIIVAKAVSPEVSWKILEMLMANEMGEFEICRSLSIKSALVTLHLERLVEAGIVTAREETLPSGDGITVYGLTSIDKSVRFPLRNYLYLSEALINGLERSLGHDSARVVLRDIGMHMGEDVVRSIRSRVMIPKWDPRTYGEHFVKGLFVEMKSQPKIIKAGRRQLIYEMLNCPFFALAEKYRGLVCDVLDTAFHEGIDRRLGDMRTKRLECKGHGDPTCKFSVEGYN